MNHFASDLRDKAAIAGIGATEFSKDSGRSEMSLAVEAVTGRATLHTYTINHHPWIPSFATRPNLTDDIRQSLSTRLRRE